jgi:small subunit ribosomal protein S6e
MAKKVEANVFAAVINDTAVSSNGASYSVSIETHYNQFLGKKIGDVIEGHLVEVEGQRTLSGYKLEITGGSDKVGTPMRADLDGGSRKSVLVTSGTGFKGTKIVNKKGNRYRYKYGGLRKRRNFRGNTITADTRQLNLKVVETGDKPLAFYFGGAQEMESDASSSEEE